MYIHVYVINSIEPTLTLESVHIEIFFDKWEVSVILNELEIQEIGFIIYMLYNVLGYYRHDKMKYLSSLTLSSVEPITEGWCNISLSDECSKISIKFILI